MGRRKGGKRQQRHSGPAENERDNDDVFDEVDTFHNERSKDLGISKKTWKDKEVEVLSVLPDGLDDLYDEDDLDKPAEDPLLKTKIASANQWGKNRREYYVNNKTRTKEDGYLNDEEQEILDLEEEDATERQKKLDGKNAVLNFDQFFEDDDDEVEEKKPFQNMTLRERMKLAATERRKEEEAKAQKIASVIETQKKVEHEVNEEDDEEKEVFVEGWDDYENGAEQEVEKRGINYQIEKNKGLIQKRKKGTEHSRIKRRLQYKKALVRRRSQIPDVKRELQKYTGEARGIRASTVKSIKIKA
ncbi:unnamed protein product [Bursaphelenchus xylophilus]|uniref:(pine wood nematode) hypothetical protein n=1 Tax=Bursaphelenchus xylophilus TaxID=6326 RepID=A0A1I7SWL7_BURXY|nr:unnamed protein product [Bursaphelenchus xylophilus]CAG9099636.1 unnamed protein product [Bursaphelenchus xylophilus]